MGSEFDNSYFSDEPFMERRYGSRDLYYDPVHKCIGFGRTYGEFSFSARPTHPGTVRDFLALSSNGEPNLANHKQTSSAENKKHSKKQPLKKVEQRAKAQKNAA